MAEPKGPRNPPNGERKRLVQERLPLRVLSPREQQIAVEQVQKHQKEQGK